MARADVAPLISMAAAPLFAGVTGNTSEPVGTASGSLFSGNGVGYFAALPPRAREEPLIDRPLRDRSPVAQLLSLIARVEAGVAGYDAVQHGARIRPSRPPTQMTLGEIHAWIAATPGQPHAIGRYQFIPPTLRRVAQIRGFGPEVRFTPEVQDALALVLLEDAGLSTFERDQMPRRQFMHNLARIWAGLPLPNGRSYYEGYAGNSAAMSWETFEQGVERIWPRG
ncbi:hypothetical protein Jann_0595 [Jannaschia sp. CCS1]|nr:hypothetical protein Jann_0595 [Jannaschia sp. CCS1]